MIVRLAQPADAPGIAAAEAATAQTPGLLVGLPGEIPVSAYRTKILALATRGRYVVADQDGLLLGHAFLDPMEMRANAHVFRLSIVVHGDHRGRGVGRALLQDLLTWAQADNRVHKVELLVRATNEVAIHLYESFGFVHEGRFQQRVKLPDGKYIDDLALAWFPGPPGAV